MTFLNKFLGTILALPLHVVGLVAASLAAIIFRSSPHPERQPRLVWGPDPILNIRYWSKALQSAGHESKTLMECFYSISAKEDFDHYTSDFIPSTTMGLLKPSIRALKNYTAFIFALKNADIWHFPLTGSYLRNTIFWCLEASLLRLANKRSVCIPYGADVFLYSHIASPSLKFALNANYPQWAKEESRIQKKVRYWSKNADVMLTSVFFDGVGRCDVNAMSPCTIDTQEWQARPAYSDADGTKDTVYVLHAPNHRYLKGTEFVIQAIDDLKKEGLQVELILAEKLSNKKIRDLLATQVDILAEQFVFCTYALSAIEAMASGVAVITNLEEEHYTRAFRRYGYLNECPIVSASLENLKERLRALITNPKLRAELGRTGRKYVEKYHSPQTAQFMFGAIYDKIWHGKELNLADLFHPLKSSYILGLPKIVHPLVENRIVAV